MKKSKFAITSTLEATFLMNAILSRIEVIGKQLDDINNYPVTKIGESTLIDSPELTNKDKTDVLLMRVELLQTEKSFLKNLYTDLGEYISINGDTVRIDIQFRNTN